MENKTLLIVTFILVAAYAVAPDLLPGPVDDMIVMALGYLITSKKGQSNIIDPD